MFRALLRFILFLVGLAGLYSFAVIGLIVLMIIMMNDNQNKIQASQEPRITETQTEIIREELVCERFDGCRIIEGYCPDCVMKTIFDE